MCTSKNENKKRFTQAHMTHSPKQPHEIQNKKCNHQIYVMNSDTREPSRLYREFEQLTFDAVQQKRNHRTEIFLARNIVTLVPRYIQRKINELNQDIEKVLSRFNDSKNKGFFHATNLIGRKEGRK